MPVGGGPVVVVSVRIGVIVGLGSMRIRPGVVVGRMPGCPAGSAIVRMFIAGLTMLMCMLTA